MNLWNLWLLLQIKRGIPAIGTWDVSTLCLGIVASHNLRFKALSSKAMLWVDIHYHQAYDLRSVTCYYRKMFYNKYKKNRYASGSVSTKWMSTVHYKINWNLTVGNITHCVPSSQSVWLFYDSRRDKSMAWWIWSTDLRLTLN